jgi:outer membrane murein-binding lipoprotein Lpp
MLEELPARMDRLESQIVQLRAENRAEFSAIRGDIATLHSRTDGLQTDVTGLRSEVGELRSEVGELRSEVGELRNDVGELRNDVGSLRTHMLVLHEDVITRIAALGEVRSKRRRPKS